MISAELQHQIIQRLIKETGVSNWLISGPEIESRECLIYKASSSEYDHSIALKVYRENTQTNFILQHDVLKRFADSLNAQDDEYFVPQVFGSFPKDGIFLMQWVDSPSLESRLWRYFYSKKHVQSDMSRTFKWLKAFHQYSDPQTKQVNIDTYTSTLKKSIDDHDGHDLLSHNRIYKIGKQRFDSLADYFGDFVTLHANLHGDFTPSNILIDDHKVTGIDLFANQNLPVDNDIALQLTYIAIEYPNMLNRFDFRLAPAEWPLLKVILDAYEYPKDSKQLDFFLFVFLFQLLRRWTIINSRNKSRRTPLLDHWRLRNLEMIVKNLCQTLQKRET